MGETEGTEVGRQDKEPFFTEDDIKFLKRGTKSKTIISRLVGIFKRHKPSEETVRKP